MPRYDYKCDTCRTITEVRQSFTDNALTTCEVCQGSIQRCYNTVLIAPSAMATRSEAAKIERDTAVMHKDVAAYKRMRKDGVQPKSIKGSAELEQRAGSRWEIETGFNLGGNEKLGRRFDEAQSAIQSGQVAEL